MEGLGLSAGLHAPLVAALEKGAVEASDPDLQSALWARAAELLEDPLGRMSDAIEAWRSALAARPDDVIAFMSLERLFSGADRPAELVDILERHLEITPDPAERLTMAKRIAVLYEDALKEPEQAVRAWEKVLEIEPTDIEALDSLAQLRLGAGAFRELVEVYARKLELTEPSRKGERRMLLMLSARIYEINLAEAEQAIVELRRVLEENPGDPEALASLDRILAAEGRHADLVEVIDARAAVESASCRPRRARLPGRPGGGDGARRRRSGHPALRGHFGALAATLAHAGGAVRHGARR